MADDSKDRPTATADTKPQTPTQPATKAGDNGQSGDNSQDKGTVTGSGPKTAAATQTDQQPATTGNGNTGNGTGAKGTGSTLLTPEQQFPQERYSVTVHPEILASQAFKDAGFLPPRQDYNYNADDPKINGDNPDYQWVLYKPQPGDTMFKFWVKYGVIVPDMRRWNPDSVAYNYVGETWKIRVLASKLPHD